MIQADRDVCIQAGNCVMVADTVFDQDDDGIVVVRVDEVPEGEEEHARMTPARIMISTLTTSTHTGKASTSHMVRSLATRSPRAAR
jgi:ferredoxin